MSLSIKPGNAGWVADKITYFLRCDYQVAASPTMIDGTSRNPDAMLVKHLQDFTNVNSSLR